MPDLEGAVFVAWYDGDALGAFRARAAWEERSVRWLGGELGEVSVEIGFGGFVRESAAAGVGCLGSEQQEERRQD